ncbi:MAG: hypothetical protein HQ488_01420 [Parcubacteria group bacterium]|nr:hypothetical protein [Parcubacteria group bacterium]
MKRPAIFSQLQKRYHGQQEARRALIGKSNEALSKSKRAIFALHRDDHKEAANLLSQADVLFTQAEKSFKRYEALEYEGAYKAALEEYAEALLFEGYLRTGKLGKIHERAMEPAVYLAGLTDTTGEMVRYAVREITLGNTDVVPKVYESVEMVVEYLLDMDLTGYLRTKFDQAKKNLSRLEGMTYDLAIRDK